MLVENKNISLGGRDQRNRALEEFYSEMDRMEAELRQYTNNKRQLSTSANGIYKSMSMADLAFQILAIVALVLFFLSFLSSDVSRAVQFIQTFQRILTKIVKI